MPLVFVESFNEFRQRQACDFVTTKKGYLFRNGARSDGAVHFDVPSEEFSAARLRREFLVVKFKEVESEFSAVKNHALEQASLRMRFGNSVPGPPSDVAEILERLKERAEGFRAAIASIDELLNESPEAQERRRNEAHEAERRQQAKDIFAQVQQITI